MSTCRALLQSMICSQLTGPFTVESSSSHRLLCGFSKFCHVFSLYSVTPLPVYAVFSHGVGLERAIEPPLARGPGEFADEDIGPHEERLVAVLDRTIGDRDTQMGLPRAARPAENRAPSFRHQLGPEVAPEHPQAEHGLEGE